MTHELAHWVRGFAGQRIFLLGDLILDRYLYGDAERISPEAPVPVLRVVDIREAVGGAANVAACVSALGCRVTCCGVVGDDENGRRLTKLLEGWGVDVSAVVTDPDRPTTTKTRLVGLAQHRHRQQLLRLDEEDPSPLGDSVRSRLVEAVTSKVSECAVCCVEDYDKGLITEDLFQHLQSMVRRAGRRVLVDPARLSTYDRYRGADVLTPNRAELALVAGRPLTTIAEVSEAATTLLGRYTLGAVLATADRDGCLLVERGAPPRHLPTTPRTVYDNTGAGDAVLAMLASALAAGADLVSAGRLANVAGGLEVEKFGCVPITADEVLAELRVQHRTMNGKLIGLEELRSELDLCRDRGETVAFTNGCFDLLHAGHVSFLKRCRREATVLVVGLNSDRSVRALGKGDDRPVNAFEQRAEVLGALECVDYVVGFDDPDPLRLIQALRPDVLIKGEDWSGRGVVGREVVESSGGRVVLLSLVEGLSTTGLIERIRG